MLRFISESAMPWNVWLDVRHGEIVIGKASFTTHCSIENLSNK